MVSPRMKCSQRKCLSVLAMLHKGSDGQRGCLCSAAMSTEGSAGGLGGDAGRRLEVVM